MVNPDITPAPVNPDITPGKHTINRRKLVAGGIATLAAAAGAALFRGSLGKSQAAHADATPDLSPIAGSATSKLLVAKPSPTVKLIETPKPVDTVTATAVPTRTPESSPISEPTSSPTVAKQSVSKEEPQSIDTSTPTTVPTKAPTSAPTHTLEPSSTPSPTAIKQAPSKETGPLVFHETSITIDSNISPENRANANQLVIAAKAVLDSTELNGLVAEIEISDPSSDILRRPSAYGQTAGACLLAEAIFYPGLNKVLISNNLIQNTLEDYLKHELCHAMDPRYGIIDKFLTEQEKNIYMSKYNAALKAYKQRYLINGKSVTNYDERLESGLFGEIGRRFRTSPAFSDDAVGLQISQAYWSKGDAALAPYGPNKDQLKNMIDNVEQDCEVEMWAELGKWMLIAPWMYADRLPELNNAFSFVLPLLRKALKKAG